MNTQENLTKVSEWWKGTMRMIQGIEQSCGWSWNDVSIVTGLLNRAVIELENKIRREEL